MRTFFLISILFTFLTGYGQPTNLSDSLNSFLSQRPAFTAKMDSRNSFITGRSIRVRSVKAGVSFGERLNFGLGYNWMISDIFFDTNEDDLDEANAKMEFQFLAPYAEYIFYKRRTWEVSIPVQIGIGKTWYTYKDQESTQRHSEEWVVSYEPAMAFEYIVLDYMGIGAGVGYRLMLKSNNQIDQQLSSPVYLMKLSVRLGKLYRDLNN